MPASFLTNRRRSSSEKSPLRSGQPNRWPQTRVCSCLSHALASHAQHFADAACQASESTSGTQSHGLLPTSFVEPKRQRKAKKNPEKRGRLMITYAGAGGVGRCIEPAGRPRSYGRSGGAGGHDRTGVREEPEASGYRYYRERSGQAAAVTKHTGWPSLTMMAAAKPRRPKQVVEPGFKGYRIRCLARAEHLDNWPAQTRRQAHGHVRGAADCGRRAEPARFSRGGEAQRWWPQARQASLSSAPNRVATSLFFLSPHSWMPSFICHQRYLTHGACLQAPRGAEHGLTPHFLARRPPAARPPARKLFYCKRWSRDLVLVPGCPLPPPEALRRSRPRSWRRPCTRPPGTGATSARRELLETFSVPHQGLARVCASVAVVVERSQCGSMKAPARLGAV